MNWLLVSVFSITFVLLILSFLFSGAEIGLTLISRSQVNKLKIDSNKRAKIIDRLLSKKELTIGTILLGNTIINIACSVLFTLMFINLFGGESVFLSTIVMNKRSVFCYSAKCYQKLMPCKIPKNLHRFLLILCCFLSRFFLH